MSRADRTVRGVLISVVSSLLAAASHSLAGGTVTFEGVVATALLGLPLCVAFAGRIASVWRVGIAVSLSQFFYHWAFAGIGVFSSAAGASMFPMGSHAAHMASLERFVPAVAESASADSVMWILHGVAALVSTAIITRGERALLALLRVIRRALPRPALVPLIHTAFIAPILREVPPAKQELLLLSACGKRGPPTTA